MPIDEHALAGLVEQSQDLHSDAMRSSTESLRELVDDGRERRASGEFDPEESSLSSITAAEGIRAGLASGGALAVAAFGATLLALTSSPAFADTPADIQMLQTSASIETLAVSTYKTALTLPYIGGAEANGVVKAFAETTMSQHAQHLLAFNSAVLALGGKQQHDPDPKYLPIVNAAVASIVKDSPSAGAVAVVELAMTLENVAAETYVNNCSRYSDLNAKRITASIMGVEAQHVAVLTAVKALLSAGAPQLIALDPSVVESLPAVAGSIGFPNAFYPNTVASPASEGAVR
jgi:hypothetical protein